MTINMMQRLDHDLKEAMKAKNADLLQTLRMVKAAIMQEAILKKKNDLNDQEIMDIFQKQVKQRKESIESFKSAGRQDLVLKEEKELSFLNQYLPKQLNESEVEKLVLEAIQVSGASQKAELGKVMKELMPKVKGLADGKLVNEVVLRHLK